MWVGTPDELRALGIWDHPVVRKYHDRIERGNGVVEALRAGVKMNPLDHFLNIDDLAVLRGESMSEAQRANVVVQSLRQVGKGYDFNFDVESTGPDRLFRADLSRLQPSGVADRKLLGRATISPDNVAVRSLPGDSPERGDALPRRQGDHRTA